VRNTYGVEHGLEVLTMGEHPRHPPLGVKQPGAALVAKRATAATRADKRVPRPHTKNLRTRLLVQTQIDLVARSGLGRNFILGHQDADATIRQRSRHPIHIDRPCRLIDQGQLIDDNVPVNATLVAKM
jgi:hypothetical protein